MEYICIRKCYHGDRLYQEGERVHFKEGAQVPSHFTPVEQKDDPNVQKPEVKPKLPTKAGIFELYHKAYSCLYGEKPPLKTELELVLKEMPKIENALREKIVNQIKSLRLTKEQEHLKYLKRCVLIVGKEIELIEGIVSYIFYVHQGDKITNYLYKEQSWSGITCEDYSYLNETDTREKLFSEGKMSKNERWIHHSNGLLFLKNLNCGHTSLLMRMVDIIHKGMAVTLVVSTDKADNLPQEFLDQFEIVRFEPTVVFDDKTQTVNINNKKYPKSKNGNIPYKEYKLLKLLYENKERRTTKAEIQQTLVMGASGESQVFNTVSKLKCIIKGSGLEIHNKKETQNVGGGYQIIFGNT